MISSPIEISHETGRAFDALANEYDDIFTYSLIGRAQRNVVWEYAARTFSSGDHILELNCGTGEDALYLGRLGMSVTACDASANMIELARRRQKREQIQAEIQFRVLPSEQLSDLQRPAVFDGVFSNFSGLNCVDDLRVVVRQLSARVKNGASLLLCLSTRICLWEIFYFALQGNTRKAFRRCSGHAEVRLGSITFPVQYPTVAELRRLFAPSFLLRSHIGVGVAVPPSYLEPWAKKHPKVLQFLQRVDGIIAGWPGFRAIGDHVLLHFEKVQP